MDNVKDLIDQLGKRMDDIENKASAVNQQISQEDILPDAVKQRHVSEGVRFIRGGATADKPTSGEKSLQGNAVFYDETTKKLYMWNTTTKVWNYVQLN